MGDNSSNPLDDPPVNLEGLGAKTTSVTYTYPHLNPEATRDGKYEIVQQYHSKPEKIRIACIGAGASGLCVAYKAERMLEEGTYELTLFEKNKTFGGTWFENTYPGVACDVPAHIYTYTFEPNTEWSSFFAGGEEIRQYFERFANKYSLHKYMKLSTKVVKTRFYDDDGIWKLTLEDGLTKDRWEDWCHVLINGTGKTTLN
jgi:cation diffusion facilitator CzcD-associated flavoprotein CzcO